MLQILGWIACAYLIVKGFELLHAGMSLPKGATLAFIGAFTAFASAVAFLIIIEMQFTPRPPDADTQANYEAAAENLEAAAEYSAASNALDNALEAAPPGAATNEDARGSSDAPGDVTINYEDIDANVAGE